MSVHPRSISHSGASQKEAKSTFDYYNYRKNVKVQEAALVQKVKELEQRKRSTLNRIKDRISQIKQDLDKIEKGRSTNAMSSAKSKKRRRVNARENTEYSDLQDGRESPPTNHVIHIRLGQKFSLMSSRERTAINKRSFDQLKARYSCERCPTPTVYSTLLKTENMLPYLLRRYETIHGLDGRILSRRHHSHSKALRLNVSTSKGSDPELRQREYIPEGNPSPELESERDEGTLSGVDFFDDSLQPTNSRTSTSVKPAKRGCHIVNAILQLPRIYDLPAKRRWIISGTDDTSHENFDETEGKQETPERITVDDVKCCRYIRGYEPEYMRMPTDITNFIFEDEVAK